MGEIGGARDTGSGEIQEDRRQRKLRDREAERPRGCERHRRCERHRLW